MVHSRSIGRALIAAAAVLLFSCCTSFDGLVREGKLNEAASMLDTMPEARRTDGYSLLADAYRQKGYYAKALELFVKAKDKPALGRLSAELLDRGEWELFFRSRREEGARTVASDEFRDNTRGWNLRETEVVSASISGGVMIVDKHEEEKVSYLWIPGKLDTDLDFRIEASITKKSGEDNNGLSLAWGVKDADDNFQLGVSGDGHYRYSRVKGGDWSKRISWTESAAIAKGNSTNVIAVEKRMDTLFFFINGEQVATYPFEDLPGDRVGVAISPKAVMEVRNFAVVEYPRAAGPWREIADKALSKADYPAALKYSRLAGGNPGLRDTALACVKADRLDDVRAALREGGLSERAARIRMASYLDLAGRQRDALSELAKAGWDLSKGFVFPRAKEDFKDNAREWGTGSDEDHRLSVTKGMYSFEKLKGEGSYLTWNDFDLSPDADYRISTSIRKVSGSDTQTYSVVWGFEKSSEALDFGILGSGSFQYGFFANDRWKDVTGKTSIGAVKKGNAENLISIIRGGESLRFFVNGEQAAQAASRDLTGGKVGFALYDKMAVAIDYLEVVEYAPEFARELARGILFSNDPAGCSRLAGAMFLDMREYKNALEAFLAAGDAKGTVECYAGLAAQAEASGDDAAAVEYYLKTGNTEMIKTLAAKAAARAAAGGDWGKAVDLYLKADPGEEVYRGLAAAYDALGKSANANAERGKLADLYAKAGKLEEAAALYEKAGNAAAARSARNRLADTLAGAGSFEAAADMYGKAGNAAKAAEMQKKFAVEAGLTAIAAGQWAKAVDMLLKAEPGEEALKALARAYDGLGKKDDAEAARSKLADWYYGKKMSEQALETYLSLTQPALLNAAGEKYFKAGDYDSAARLFQEAGNDARETASFRASAASQEKEGKLEEAAVLYDKAGDAAAAKRVRNRLADSLVQKGSLEAAWEMYVASGNTAKAAELDKKLSVMTALPGKALQPGEALTLAEPGFKMPRQAISARNPGLPLTIKGIERASARGSGDSPKVTFRLRMQGPFAGTGVPVLYFSSPEEYIIMMFDAGSMLYAGSRSGSIVVSWNQEGSPTAGYKLVDKNLLQCDVALSREHYDMGSYGNVTDYSLSGKSFTLYAFILDGNSVTKYTSLLGGSIDDVVTALSNVYSAKVSF